MRPAQFRPRSAATPAWPLDVYSELNAWAFRATASPLAFRAGFVDPFARLSLFRFSLRPIVPGFRSRILLPPRASSLTVVTLGPIETLITRQGEIDQRLMRNVDDAEVEIYTVRSAGTAPRREGIVIDSRVPPASSSRSLYAK